MCVDKMVLGYQETLISITSLEDKLRERLQKLQR